MVVPEGMIRTVERLAQNLFISAPHVAQVAAGQALGAASKMAEQAARRLRRQVVLAEVDAVDALVAQGERDVDAVVDKHARGGVGLAHRVGNLAAEAVEVARGDGFAAHLYDTGAAARGVSRAGDDVALATAPGDKVAAKVELALKHVRASVRSRRCARRRGGGEPTRMGRGCGWPRGRRQEAG